MGRDAFRDAADYFLTAVEDVPADRWHAPGLGEWTVRDLVGHTGRAFRTLAEYLAAPAPPAVEVASAVEYYVLASTLTPAEHAAVAQRGRDEAEALGDDPVAAIAELRERALGALDATADDHIMTTAAGAMRLGDYLATRTFELVVHTVDLRHAMGRPVEPPPTATAEVLGILGGVAVRSGHAGEVLAMLTGRAVGGAGRFSLI